MINELVVLTRLVNLFAKRFFSLTLKTFEDVQHHVDVIVYVNVEDVRFSTI